MISLPSSDIALCIHVEIGSLFQNNYGQHDPEKVALVKQLYKDLDLQRVYLEYEEESYKDLMDIINECSDNLPKEMFFAFARKIYKRQK